MIRSRTFCSAQLQSFSALSNIPRLHPVSRCYPTIRTIYVASRQPSRTANAPRVAAQSQDERLQGMTDAFAPDVGLEDSIVQGLKSHNVGGPLEFTRRGRLVRAQKTRRWRRQTSDDLVKSEAQDLEKKIIEVERYTKALEKHIKQKDEEQILLRMMKESEEKYGKLTESSAQLIENRASLQGLPSVKDFQEHTPQDGHNLDLLSETNRQATLGSNEKSIDSATDSILEFLDLPESEAKSQLKKLRDGDDAVSAKSISNMKQSFFLTPASSITLSESVLERVGSSVSHIASESSQNWAPVIEHIYKGKGLVGVPPEEVSLLLKQIPLDQRVPLVSIIHEMMWDAEIPFTKLIYDNIIAAYAHVGNTDLVEIFIDEMKSKGFEPDQYTYGNLIKSHSKTRSLSKAVKTVKEMQMKGIPIGLPSYDLLIRTCISVNDFKQAYQVFDMLKFLGTDTLPDVHMYNTIMVAALKERNVNKVLDLYKEMTTRPTDPLEPNELIYSTLIQACSRDPAYHLQAWKFLLELHEKGLSKTRQSLNSMLALCGETGEISFARAIFWQMCAEPVSYPDSFSLFCLFKAYSNYKPGAISPVLGTSIGSKLRAAVFMSLDNTGSSRIDADLAPPFLPAPVLNNKIQVLAESRAIFQFFKDLQHPRVDDPEAQAKSNKTRWIISPVAGKVDFINDKTASIYLEIPINLDNHKELTYRWKTATCVEVERNKVSGRPVSLLQTGAAKIDEVLETDKESSATVEDAASADEPSKSAQFVEDSESTTYARKKPTQSNDPLYMNRVPRTAHMYDVLISGHSKNQWSYEKAKGVWESRGEWRRNPFSTYRQQLDQEKRAKADFSFARRMVEFLARDKKLEDAVDLVRSSTKQFVWKKSHLIPVLEVAQQYENEEIIRAVNGIIGSYKYRNA